MDSKKIYRKGVTKMKIVHMITFILLAVGGLNWGLVGAFDFNLVTKLLGTGMFTNVVYILVGLSAVFELVTHKQNCKMCSSSTQAPAM
jgi:uncharacterized protein